MRISLLLFFILTGSLSIASDQEYGYAVIQNDTIYGDIKINFEAGSVVVKQASVNKMFVSDIQSVTLLNQSRDTYHAFRVERKTRFFKVLVGGSIPLFSREKKLFAIIEGELTELEGVKTLYALFGKKEVKEYVFVRNISTIKTEGIVDVFRYFNQYKEI